MGETAQVEASERPWADDFFGQVDRAIARAQHSLLRRQQPAGYWHAPLEANAQMNSEFIIFNHFMGAVDRELEARLARFLLETQQADGSWSLYPGGEGYLSYSVEAYFALKLAQVPIDDERMIAARRWILSCGGIERCGTLARFYLASLGQVPWDAAAALPVEIALLPAWFPGSVYQLASWARGTMFALGLLQVTRPVVPVDDRYSAAELYLRPPHLSTFRQPRGKRLLSLRSLLNGVDRALRMYDCHHLKSLRARAVRYAESWILEHQEVNGSFGGIEPCYLLSTMALKGLGYSNRHPVVAKALEASRELIWEMGDKALCMPCVSPNWNTALAAKALLESGVRPDHPALRRAGEWLIDHQIFKRGDWAIKRPNLEPGGWAFEFFNTWYPDIDDSAVILMVLAGMAPQSSAAYEKAIAAGTNWVLGMQSRNGGFAAFDTDADSSWLNHLPLADVEAVTDPPCPDLTGRVLEMMGAVGYHADHPVARKAIRWLKREQELDGSWWGRWGVNYIYGTFSALSGLHAIGVNRDEPWVRRGVEWLKSRQNLDGGWGESCLSDRDPAWRGRGASTASQTAWALMGLLAGEDELSDSVIRGAQWLIEHQNRAGAWDETAFTGNGFPNHFYLRYYLYPHYFPLMALGRLRSRLEQDQPARVA